MRPLADDLYLVCWDDDAGGVRPACQDLLGVSLAGALALDAVVAGAITLDDDVVRPAAEEAEDPLVDRALDVCGGRARTLTEVVEGLSAGAESGVRARLVDTQRLRTTRTRRLLAAPRERLALSDPATVAALRDQAVAALTGQEGAAQATPREVALASFVAVSGLVDELDELAQDRAEQLAPQLAETAGTAVAIEVVAEVQLRQWARAHGSPMHSSHALGIAAGGLGAATQWLGGGGGGDGGG